MNKNIFTSNTQTAKGKPKLKRLKVNQSLPSLHIPKYLSCQCDSLELLAIRLPNQPKISTEKASEFYKNYLPDNQTTLNSKDNTIIQQQPNFSSYIVLGVPTIKKLKPLKINRKLHYVCKNQLQKSTDLQNKAEQNIQLRNHSKNTNNSQSKEENSKSIFCSQDFLENLLKSKRNQLIEINKAKILQKYCQNFAKLPIYYHKIPAPL